MTQNEIILEMRNISKSFGNNKVLENINLTVKYGKVVALMGENGAGKSTLMKILNGLYKADEGGIFFSGEKINITCPKEAIDKGIAMIHQELTPVPEMTVYENIFLGRELVKLPFNIIDKKQMISLAKEMLQQIGIKIDPNVKMSELSVAEMQMVEIVKAINVNAKVIAMDEPTSAITEKEVTKLFEVIAHLKSKGCGIIYISHKMDEIFKISDEICVLRDGQHIVTKSVVELDNDKLISLMVGRELNEVYPQMNSIIGDVFFEVRNLSCKGKFEDITFSVKKGEVLGFAGLVGAGRTEVMESLFGINPATSGEIFINNKKVVINSEKDAIKNKIALVPEDRKLVGLNLMASIKDNMTIVNLKKYCKLNFIINLKSEIFASDGLIKEFNVKTTGRNKVVGQLSGGNQQKVALAKWLSTVPEIIIFDEPTRGIDVGAKAEIYKMMRELAKSGKTIIVVSSEMSEILGICDRIIVMSGGRQTGIFDRDNFKQEKIMECASY